MHIHAQLLCTTHTILEPRPLLSYKNAFTMAESVATNIDYDKLAEAIIGAQENQKSNKTTASKGKIIIILNIFIVVFLKIKMHIYIHETNKQM